MAREVVATLDIDETEAVAALKKTGAQFQVLEGGASKAARTLMHEFDRAGPAFVHHMFSMRAAAGALLGTVSLAGVILAITNLGKELLKADPAFQELTKSASGLKSEFAALVGSVLPLGSGLQEATTWMDRLSAAMVSVRGSVEDTPGSEAGAGFLKALLFGVPGIGPLLADLHQLGGAMDLIFDKQIKQIEAQRKVGGASLFEEWQKTLTELDAGYLAAEHGVNAWAAAPGFKMIDGIMTQIAKRLPDTLTKAEELSNPLQETWQEMQMAVEGVANGWQTAADELQGIQESDVSGKLGQDFQVSAKAMQLAADALTAVGQSITTHILQGGLTFKKVFADMLMSMVPVLLGLAAIHLLEYDFAGAAYAFGAAIAVTLAAKALGAGQTSYGGGSSRGASAAVPSGTGGQSSPTFNFTFEGPILGGSTDALMRTITMGVKKALKDGVGGGTLDFSTEPI